MRQKRIKILETSSCARFIDAIGSLVRLHHVVSFEAQAAKTLEAIAANSIHIAAMDQPASGSITVDTREMVWPSTADIRRIQGLFPQQVPANDGRISVGQAAIA